MAAAVVVVNNKSNDDDQLLRRLRSPSTSSVPANWTRTTKAGPGGGAVVTNESAASLIGSDSALLVRDKPPLPRGRAGSLCRKKNKKPLQPSALGLDTDDDEEEEEVGHGNDEVNDQLQRTDSSKKKGKGSVFRGALNFFKSR